MAGANEELDVVPMSFLVKSGLFKNKSSIISLTFKQVCVSISYNENDSQLMLLLAGRESRKCSIGISHHHLERGTRWYFDIFNNQEAQLHFIIHDEDIHSSESLLADRTGLSNVRKKELVKLARQRAKFFVPSGAGPVSTRRLAVRARETLSSDELEKLPRETIAAFGDTGKFESVRSGGKDAQNELSSKYAFANTLEPPPYRVEHFCWTSPEQLRRQHPLTVPPIELIPQPIDNHCRLDIADLNHAGMLKPGKVSIRELPWPLEATMGRIVTLYADLRDKRHPMLLFELLIAEIDQAFWQRVMLTRVDNARWHFVCPLKGNRCDTLYLRANRFASWKAQKLYHPSQRGRTRSNLA